MSLKMDVSYYVGIGIAIGSAIGGAVAGVVSLRKQKYTQARDEFKLLIAELKEDKEQKEAKIDELSDQIDILKQNIFDCRKEHLEEKLARRQEREEIKLLRQQLDQLRSK